MDDALKSPTRSPNLRPPWKKGQTGNAGGKPRKTEPEREAEAVFKANTPAMARELVRKALNPKDRDQIRALEIALDRGLGKVVARDGTDLTGLTFVVQQVTVAADPVSGVLNSPIASHIDQAARVRALGHSALVDVIDIADKVN